MERSEDAAPGPPSPMPRWVKVFVVIGVALLVLLVVLQFLPGDHGPGRHGGDHEPPPVHHGGYR